LNGFKNRRKILIILSIFLLICLIFANYFLFFYIEEKEKNTDKEKINKTEIDNRISPLTNQGLNLEINRIRNRNLLDKIMKLGISWRIKPKFYVKTVIDGLEYSSYDEFGFYFNTWDTLGQDFRIIHDAEEEQKTSDIKIIIMQEEKTGLFRSSFKQKEIIELKYDYRTGLWSEYDYKFDSDGYGHYVGQNYELWFNLYQMDFDHDGIPYNVEVNQLFTNPRQDDSKLDPDNDGIPSSWEWKWGYDPFRWDDHENLDPDIDGLSNIEEYQMQKWFADPFSQDIYIEVDSMDRGGLFDPAHTLSIEPQQIIIERFCRHNINVYIDNGWPGELPNAGGEVVPHKKTITWDSGKILQYYKNHFPEQRKGIFRYLLMCHSTGKTVLAYSGNTKFNMYDTMVVGMRFYERLLPQRIKHLLLTSTILHELGHTLSIAPYTIEGCDNASFLSQRKEYLKEWGNYKSVMNYFYANDLTLVDFSDGTNGYNDQNDWENFYLPFFQIENNIVIEPGITPPATDKVVNEDLTICLKGWEYDKNLTNIFKQEIKEWSPVSPIECNWSVYVKTGKSDLPSNKNLRIYARPKVPISQWSLISEGYLDEDNYLQTEINR
jgi:hypothetical protein